ncbi:hypothetical protein [Actinomadura flavalba]|uniref:hypothetical protein n=1 Tax=Actinomadura flavalba TaxID=1120938 RepID=UPI000363F6EC|nr:hypothetical protein [Actinomadura flavalba]
MEEETTLRAVNSHLYPGSVVSVDGEVERLAERPRPLLFDDDSQSAAQLVEDDVLWVAAYMTTAGTPVPEKLWLVAVEGSALRLRRRLPGDV